MSKAVSRLRDACASGARGAAGRKFDAIVGRLETRYPAGLDPATLHELVVVWTEYDLPARKWIACGRRMVPERCVEPKTALHLLRWIRGNVDDAERQRKVAFGLGWLSGLLEYDLVDASALDPHYEFFFFLLNNDALCAHAASFTYRLSKPHDATRSRTVRLLKLAELRKRSKCRNAVYAVLNLFKTFKPECVPEDLPPAPPDVVFPEPHVGLVDGFRRARATMRRGIEQSPVSENILKWYPMMSGQNGKKPPNHLIPKLQYIWQGTDLGFENSGKKSCFEFQTESELLLHDLADDVNLPARMLSLLVNDAGLHLIMFSNEDLQSRFSFNLYEILYNNYIQKGSFSYEEKSIFLEKIATLQKCMMQGIPVVSRFLAIFMSTWNGHDFFKEIFVLLEWITYDSFQDLYDCILGPLETLYFTKDIHFCCAVVNMLKKLYAHAHDRMLNKKPNFFLLRKDNLNYLEELMKFTDFLNILCEKSSEDIQDHLTLRNAFIDAYETVAKLQITCDRPIWTVTPIALTYTVLCSFNAYSIDRLCGIFQSYRKIYEKIRLSDGKKKIENQISTIQKYSSDYLNCLLLGESLLDYRQSLLFNRMPLEIVENISTTIDDCDMLLHFCYHPAFASTIFRQISPEDLLFFLKQKKTLKVFSDNLPNIPKFIETILTQND